jgi:hypothetical protein
VPTLECRPYCGEYEGNPPPSAQRIIFSGALLRDEKVKLTDVLRSADLTAPQVFHMVGGLLYPS